VTAAGPVSSSATRAHRLAQLGICVQFLALVRSLGEVLRLQHVHGGALPVSSVAPYVGGGLLAALLTWAAVLRELRRTPIPVPHPLARPLLGTLFRYRLANFPPPELDHIQFLCMVDGSRWTADVGWVPGHSMKDTIRSVDGERAAA